MVVAGFVNVQDETVTLRGLNFGKKAPTVFCETRQMTVLRASSTEVVVRFPAEVGDGTYLFTVARGNHDLERGAFYLTKTTRSRAGAAASPARRDRRARLVLTVRRDKSVRLDQLDHRVHKAPQGQRAAQARLAPRVRRDLQAPQVRPERLVPTAFRVHKVRQARQVRRVLPVCQADSKVTRPSTADSAFFATFGANAIVTATVACNDGKRPLSGGFEPLVATASQVPPPVPGTTGGAAFLARSSRRRPRTDGRCR